MSDIVISRVSQRGPCSFDVRIKIAEFRREFQAGTIDLSYSKCEKRSFPLRFLFLDFDCHPKPDESLSSGSFLFKPLGEADSIFADAPLAQLFFNRRITCKLTKEEESEEDDECVRVKYRLAVWARADANPEPIIDVRGKFDASSRLLGGAEAAGGGGTVPDLEDQIIIEVCCVDRDDVPQAEETTPMTPAESGAGQPGEDEGVVRPLPEFQDDSDCVIRCRVLSHRTDAPGTN